MDEKASRLLDPQCTIASELRLAFKKSVPLPEIGQVNQFCTENSVRTNAAALTELVDCPNPSSCEICLFANYYRQECILLQCTHRTYNPACIHCCTRRCIEIYTNPSAFVNAHCNPDPKMWTNGFPTVYTQSKEKNTSIRTVRERYTTPRSRAQDRRREDWTTDQQLSLALAYLCTGAKLGASKPKIEEKLLQTAKNMLGRTQESPCPNLDAKVTPNQLTEEIEKTEKTDQEAELTIQPSKEILSGTSTVASIHSAEYKDQIEQIDTETQELANQILKNHELTESTTSQPSNLETTPELATRINLVRLCLCSNPQCEARQGQRTTGTNQEKQQPPIPQIAHTQTSDNKPIKTIQIQFEEWVPFAWEQAAAYITCHNYNVKIKALIDTGSCISIISYKKAVEISSQPEWKSSGGAWDQTVYIKAYSCTNTLLKLVGRITVPGFSFGNRKTFSKGAAFWVLLDASEECIIAGEWLLVMKAVISMQQKVLYYSLPQATLSAGAEEFVMKKETNEPEVHHHYERNLQRSETENDDYNEPPNNQTDQEVSDRTNLAETNADCSPTIQRITDHIRKHGPYIPTKGHYSSTIGPARPQDRPMIGIFINNLPSKIVVQQSKLILHITNTSSRPATLDNELSLTAATPENQKLLTRNQSHNIASIHSADIPPHLRLDNEEFERTKNHVDEWAEKQRSQGDLEAQEGEAEGVTASNMLEDLEKLQAQFDFKEYMNEKYLPIDQTKLTFAEYPTFGESPFNEKTDKLTIFLCYILLAIGQTLQLQTLSRTELTYILQDFRDKSISTLKKQVDQAASSNNIAKLYHKIPLHICHHLHIDFIKAFDNIEKLRKTKKRLPTREYHTIEPAILKNIVIKTQAWSTLLFYVQKITSELASTYGQHPYFQDKAFLRHQKQHFKEIPAQLQGMPTQLFQQIMDNHQETPKIKDQNTRVRNNKIKNKQEFNNFILPTATTYQDREYSFEQFKQETLHNYDMLNQQAQDQVKPPVPPNIYKALSIDQLKSPEEIQDFVTYATSPSSLHNFMREQLPPSIDQVIPIGSFLKTLSKAKMVIYNTPEEAIQDYIPTEVREEFDQFFTMFKDKDFISASASLRLPDYPQMWVWGTEFEPSSLHDINTGLVLPKWLAFCTTQMLSKDDIILQPEFATELALLAALIFVYGQFTISLHANHTGLFREDVFRAKTLLCPNTAVQNAKPPKNMGMTACPDLDDKVEFMLRHGKAVRVNCSPFLTSMTSIAKKRKTGKPLEFPQDSPLLQHLLSMTRSKQDQLAQQSQQIMKAREDLARCTQQNHLADLPNGCRNQQDNRIRNHPRSEAERQQAVLRISVPPTTRPRHIWTQSLFIEQFQQIHLNKHDEHLNHTWNPPFNDREKKYILNQIDRLSYVNPRSHDKNKPEHPKRVKWGSALIVKYDPIDVPEPVQKSMYYPQYFKTQADHDLHQALENNQQVGNGSRHLVCPKERDLKQKAEKTRYCVKFAFDNNLAHKTSLNTPINPEASRRQGLLTNAHIFHQLIEDTSTLALQARIGPDHPQYEEIMKISIHQVHNNQNPLLKVTTLLNHQRTASSLKQSISQAIQTIGNHAVAVRQIASNNINTEAPENWQQCQKALSLVLGTALVHATENANMLASVGPTLNRFIRARRHLQAYKLKTKHQQIARELVKGIWPERARDWNQITIAEAKNHFKTWETLFGEIAKFYKYPLVVVEGAIIKKSQRAYFDVLKVAVYRASLYNEELDLFGHMATCFESQEIFSTRTSSIEFIKCLIHQAKGIQQEKPCEYNKFTIKEILTLQQEHQRKSDNHDAQRYSRVHFQHLEMDVYWKRDPSRTIINTRYNNHLSRESNTTFQSQHDIRQSLANSQFYSSFDLSSFYDQILSCPTSSLINTVLYQGQELALTIASMGSRNSCLWASAVVLSLLHHHTDDLLLQPCYRPKPIGSLKLKQQESQLTPEMSYSMEAPLHMPHCDLMMRVIEREQNQDREIATQHVINLTPEQRKRIKSGSNHQLLHQVTLIDDFCISTSEFPNITSHKEQIKQQLNVHLLCLKQLWMTAIQCSRQPENSTRSFQPVKFKIEKAHLFKDSVKFLNFIYIGNFQIINLDAFKGATNLDNLPTTGEALASRISFFTYFMAYIPNLRYMCKDLETFGQKFPNNKILPWADHPDIAQKYRNLATTSRALSGLAVLPNDLNKINFLVLSSDACNRTMAYSVGVSLHPDPDKSNQTPMKQAKLLLVRNYSCNLEDNLLNLPIASKETMSACKTLVLEEPLLKLVRGKKIYHIIDNSVLFGLLEQLQNSKELANHFLAHTQLRDWVMRLHQLTTLYNITILLVPSKCCIADVCTRSGEESQIPQAKNAKGVACNHIQEKPEKTTCSVCPICNIACHKTSAHRNCTFNIRNTTKLSQHGPQLLAYKTTTNHTMVNEGDTINYVTASTTFDPNDYEELHIDQLVATLDLSPQKSVDQDQATSAERTLHQEIEKLETIGTEEVEEELQLIKEALTGTYTQRSQEEEAHSTQHNVNAIASTATNLQATQCPRRQLKTMPRGMFQINLYGKYVTPPTTANSHNTTILIFTGIRKSMRIAKSIYANQLIGSHTEKLERRANGVTFTESQGELSYLISCTPQDKLGRNSAGSPENFLPQLHEALKQASVKSPDKDIILDGNSVQKFYNLSTERIMTGLILVSQAYRSYFPHIGLITWHKTQESKMQRELDLNQPLEIVLPIFKNKIKQCTTRLTLNDKGQCLELIEILKDRVWLGHQARIQVEFENGFTENYRRNNLSTAQAIHVTQRQLYTRSVQQETNPDATELRTYTTEEAQSHEPIIDALMAKRKLMINQANDSFLIPIFHQLRQAAEQNKILQSEDGKVQLRWKDDIVYGKLSQTHDDNAWRPVLPESLMLPEILAAHMAQRCSSAHNAVEQVKKIFFHKRFVTSHYDLEAMSQKILPCPRCIIRRPHSKTGNKLYAQTKSIVMSLKGLPCATLAHDIIYITKPQSQEFKNKYLSIIVCYGCAFIHLKMIDKITGHNIATHVLDMIQMTGNIPHVLITDSATTELRGILAQCIQSLNVIQLKTNQKILEKKNPPPHYGKPRPQESNQDNEDPTIDPAEFPTVLIDQLNEDQRNMLLQDFLDTTPPLYPPILSHSPVPYIDKQSYRSTSLGRLDFLCGQIGIFLRKFITTQPELLEDENIEFLVQSFAFSHNFLHPDVRTKQFPAKLHLGALRFFNTRTFMERLQSHETITDPEPIKKLQSLLKTAQEHREAQVNRNTHEQNTQRQHLTSHGRLKKEEEIQDMFPTLSIVMLNTELDHTKTSKRPNLHGPHLVLARVPNKRTVYLYNLIDGHIYKRSFRAIQNLLPSQEIFSTPNILDWFHFHPLQMISKLSTVESTQPELTTEQYTAILKNLAKVYELLRPVLPDAIDTQKILTIDEPHTGEDENLPMNSNNEQEIEGGNIDKAATKKSVQFQDDQNIEQITDLTLNKQKESQQEEPDPPINTSYQHQGAQGIDVAAPLIPKEPTPSTSDLTRTSGRPKRTRAIPSRYRD